MNVAIVYDSRTGTTLKAAEAMAKMIEENGHHCSVKLVTQADPAEVSEADLICVGTWVEGLFIIFQHPTAATMDFVDRLDNLTGKKVVVFCTHKLAAGSTMRRMAKALEKKGASVVGQFKFRGPEPNEDFAKFVASLN